MANDATCMDCGERYGSDRFPDLVVPHAAWKRIAPNDGLLCPNCLCARANRFGIHGEAVFRSGPFAVALSDTGETMKHANDNERKFVAANDNELTLVRLRHLLHYDPETGLFTWLVNKGNVKAGYRAGKHAKNGYWRIKIDGRKYPAHRLAWFYVYGVWPDGVVDHINRDTIDNRIINLRDASSAENQYNRREQSNNTSGFKGVSRFARTGKWRADIKFQGKSRYLGSFNTPEEASAAYDAAAVNFHGEFARNADGVLSEKDLAS